MYLQRNNGLFFQSRDSKMNCKKMALVCGVFLTAWGASAQMPEPLLSGGADGKPVALQATQRNTAKQLEALLLCKAGTHFTVEAVESQLQALGLIKSKNGGGYWLPHNGHIVSVFGDTLMAAMVSSDFNNIKKSLFT
jgi:hypothetical protein